MFSVVIPYYKKRKYIERCIDSIYNQTYKNFEIIVVDDGSEDDIDTLFANKYPLVNLVRQSNQGVSVARNTGISLAQGNYICFLDADDAWHIKYLEFAKHIIDNNSDVKIIGSRYTRRKSDLEKINDSIDYKQIRNYFKTALKNTLFTSSSSIVLKEFFADNTGFNSKLKSGEDIDVWFRIISTGGNVYYINNVLVYYSDEDENQATIVPKDFSRRFIANIDKLYFNENKIDNKEFYIFLSKFIYSSLYNFKYNAETKKLSNKIKSSITTKYFFADLFYLMPFKIGEYVIKNNKLRKLARLYFKFIFKYIHN